METKAIQILTNGLYFSSPLEHIFPNSLIIVGEDEPSTIVAYTLSCEDYTNMLKEIRKGNHTDAPVVTDEQSMQNDQYNEKEYNEKESSTSAPEPATGIFIERTLRSKSGIHMKYCKLLFKIK